MTPSSPAASDHSSIPRLAEVLPSLRRAGMRFVSAGAVPLVAFYVAFRLGGPIVGIVTGMAVSLTVLSIQAYRLRRLDPIALVAMVLIVANGTLGVATGSVEVYLAAPAVEAMIWGCVLIGSVLLKRPLVPLVARELGIVPSRFAESVGMLRSLEMLTVAWGVAAFVKAGLRLWLLTMLPLEVFLIAVTVANTGVNVMMAGFSVWLPFMMFRREPKPQAA
jgi:hypothetical protein